MDASSFIFCAILLIFNRHLPCHAEENEVDEVLQMMREGDHHIDLGFYENYVVVLGLTGAGKSTVVNVLAADNTKLKAVRFKNKYLFIDEGKKISSANETTLSKTFHPEVTYDNETNTAFVDCPGFSDTRSVQHEIASAYFISKVFEHARNLKILLVVEQNSVESTGSRTDFVKLVNYIANMFPNIDQMKRSFHTVVTKVTNIPDYSDSDCVDDTKDFIGNVVQNNEQNIKNIRQQTEVSRLRKIIKVTKILYEFSSISIAKRPNVTGPVSEIPFIQAEKKRTKECLQNLSFVNDIKVDLNSSLSSDAILFVRDELTAPVVEVLLTELQQASNFISNEFIVKATKVSYNERAKFVEELQNIHIKLSDLRCFSCVNFTAYVNLQFNITETQYDSDGFYNLLRQFQFLCSVQKTEAIRNLLTAFSKHKKTIQNLLLWFDTISIFDEELSILIENDETGNRNLNNFKLNLNSTEVVIEKAISISTRMVNMLNKIRTSGQNNHIHKIFVPKINSVIDAKIKFIRNIILPSKVEKLVQYMTNLSQLMNLNLNHQFQDLSMKDDQMKVVSSHFESYNKLKNLKFHHQFIELIDVCFRNYSALYQREEIKFHLTTYIKYFSLIANSSEINYNKFLKEFEGYFKYLENLKSIFTLIECVKVNAVSYDYQNARSIYFEENKLNSNEAISRFVQSKFPMCGDFDISTINETDRTVLQKHLKSVLKSHIKYETRDHVLTIHAKCITASEMLEIINKYITGNLIRINVFVSNTIFIDEDIKLSIVDDLQLNIFALTWRIMARHVISLNGKNNIFRYNDRATENKQPERPMYSNFIPGNGSPGLPGHNGGNILAIAQNIYGKTLLTLESRGGKGAIGQDGRHGLPGNDAEYPRIENNANFARWLGNGHVQNELRKKYNYRFNNMQHSSKSLPLIVYDHDRLKIKLEIFNDGGTPGFDGGNGGRGGLGGNSGLINIISPSQILPDINVNRKIGENGVGGKGGSGGIGGLKTAGYYVYFKEHKARIVVFKLKTKTDYEIRKLTITERHERGKVGVDNLNAVNIIHPKSALMSVGNDIVNYFDHIITSDVTSDYIDLIIQPRVEGYVSSRDIVNMVVRLMKRLPQLRQRVIRSVCEVLMKNIELYYHRENDESNKKLLHIAKMALLSALENVDEKQNQYYITNLMAFSNEIKSSIETVRRLGKLEAKTIAKSKFDAEINNNLELLLKFLSSDISVEFEKTNKDLQNFVTSLESEVRSKISNAENDRAALASTAKQIQETAGKRNFFTFLRGCVDFVANFIPPAGRLLGFATNFVNSITQDTITTPKLHSTTMSSLRKFDKSIEYLSNIFDSRGTAIKNLITNLNVAFQKYPNETKQLSSEINELGMKYFNKNTSSFLRATLGNQIMNTVDNYVLSYENLIKSSNITLNKILTNKKVVSLIKFSKRVSKFVGPSIELFSSIIENQAVDDRMLQDIATEIERKENEVNELNNFQQRIYSNIVPILTNLQNKVKTLGNPIENSSRDIPEIKKWKVNKAISDIKFEMGQFLESFESSHEFKRYISKLSDLSDMVGFLYQRLEGYFERLRLSQYIYDVNTYDIDALANSDPVFRTNLRQLKLASQCNVLLSLEKKVLSSLKMRLFPFTESLKKLSQRENEKNLTQLTTEVIENLDEVSVTLNGLYNKIGNNDRHIFTTQFSKNQSVGAFASWENKNHKSKINSLLSGSEVFFKSKFSKFNAVKFQAIHLEIYANDLERQSNLSKILENFRIEMTHSGQSYYRCDFQYFVVQSSPLTISYGFKYLDGTRNRTHTNRVYNKLSHNEITLSPYTWWGFKLIELVPRSFIKLQPYRGQVHLALEGYGEYIPLNAEICGTDLVQHYEEYVGLDMEFDTT